MTMQQILTQDTPRRRYVDPANPYPLGRARKRVTELELAITDALQAIAAGNTQRAAAFLKGANAQ